MTKSLAQIQATIKKLEQEAETIRKREISGVIVRMKEAIAHYNLTAADLGLSTRRATASNASDKSKSRRKSAKKGSRRGTGVVKYRDEAGNTWTGHGRRPQWFIQALGSGKTAADLAV